MSRNNLTSSPLRSVQHGQLRCERPVERICWQDSGLSSTTHQQHQIALVFPCASAVRDQPFTLQVNIFLSLLCFSVLKKVVVLWFQLFFYYSCPNFFPSLSYHSCPWKTWYSARFVRADMTSCRDDILSIIQHVWSQLWLLFFGMQTFWGRFALYLGFSFFPFFFSFSFLSRDHLTSTNSTL